MPAAAERIEFLPPPQPGPVRAFVLALIAHLLLMLALTWGINWNRESENIAAEAELWSSVPQAAAPREVPAPPPAPPPVQATPTPPPPPAPREADIALEREKLKKEQALRKLEELERQKKLEARKKREELEREKKLEAKKKEDELKKQQLAEEQKRKKEELAKKAKQEEAKLAALRKENMERMMKGATGGPAATGTALRSAGPSDSYAGRIRARVRPNIVFADDVAGNPMAEVEVRLAPDGTITSRRLVKSSGVKSWDEAVLRALDKTEILPKDVDGRVHSPLTIEFKPKG